MGETVSELDVGELRDRSTGWLSKDADQSSGQYTKQNLMNKINSSLQIVRQPVRNPSPDFKNQNKIVQTCSPTPQVKKYLQSIKQINQSNRSIKHEHTEGKSEALSEQSYSRLNEQMMRRRINELELENNEFRVCMKDYEQLVSRNRELEDQMLLLLEELQSREDDRLLYEKMAVETRVDTRRREEEYAKDHYYNTNESSHEESHHEQLQYSQRSGTNSSKELKIVEPFDFLTIQKEELMEENAYLKAQNLKIKELVDLEVRESIRSLEEKFMDYIVSMEQKMNELNESHQEIVKLRQSPAFDSRVKEDSFSLGERFEGKSQIQDSKDWNRWDKSSHHSSLVDKNLLLAENPVIHIDLSTIPLDESQQGQDLKKQSSQGSRVHIEMSSLSDSNQSFGKTINKRLNVSPATPDNNIFNNIKFVQSSSPNDSNYESIVIGRIWEDINSLRDNLVFMLGERSRIIDPSLLELEKKVETEMKSIVEQFFPARESSNLNHSLRNYFENIENDTLRFDNQKLQQRVQQLEQELVQLRRHESQQPCSRSKAASEIYLQQSYYMQLPEHCESEFEQSKRKLLRVIDVIKTFNNDFQFVLSPNKSLQQLQCLPSSN